MTTQPSGRHGPVTGPPGVSPRLPERFAPGRRTRRHREAPRRFPRVLKLALITILPVVLLTMIGVGIGYVRLMHGPISLQDFSAEIEESMNAELDGFTAHIDDAQITLAEDYKVELRLTNLRLQDNDGDLVASAPLAALELDRSALWRLAAVPKRVYLIEPSVTVTYSDEHGLALSIAQAPAVAADGVIPNDTEPNEIVPPSPVPAVRPESVSSRAPPSFHHINFARLLAESSARARRGRAPTSGLKAFGLRNARVTIIHDDRTTEVLLTEAAVDVDHSKRDSVLSGSATIESAKGPWSFTFRTEDSERRDVVHVSANVENLVPSTIAPIADNLGLLNMFDTPVRGALEVDLTAAGDLRSADLSIGVGTGFVRLPALGSTPFMLDSGKLALRYDAAQRRLDLAPSTFDWGGSRITLAGAMQSDPAEAGEPQWHFALRSVDGSFSAEEFGVAPIPVESLEAMGRIIPGEDLVQLSGLSLNVGGGVVNVNGEIIGGASPSTRVEASVSPMPLATLKAMWPRAVSPAARDWVGAQVERANLRSASLKLLSGRFLEAEADASADGSAEPAEQERLSARIEIGDLRMVPLPNSLPIEADQAVIRLENSALEVSVPEAQIVVDETRRMPLNDVRLTAVDVMHEAPVAELALRSETSLAKLIETLNRSQLHLTGEGPLPITGVDGTVKGEIKIAMPLIANAKVSKIEGKARISDLKGESEERGLTLQGGMIDAEASDVGVIAKGNMSVNGVTTQVHMHHILDAPADLQPPIRISAKLDNADRLQLGLDVNHLIQGEIAADITITQKEGEPEPDVHVEADLTNAELIFEELAWRKQPGRQASLQFDMKTLDADRTHLDNFKVVGDMIALDGWLISNSKRELLEYAFPNFSLNVVSRLAVQGKVDANKIWKVKVKGSTFDAKDLFRSLLALGKPTDASIAPVEPIVGVDLTAEIDTVLGHSDVSLREYAMKLSHRNGQLVSLEGTGTLDGGHPFAVFVGGGGERKFFSESTDAGQTFKMVGFYPNVQGGRMRLEVDLEGRGAAEKSGVLWVDDFRVLGDPIISEVYLSAEGGTAGAGQTKRQGQPKREVFEFQRMRVPFSVGHGQFVLGNSQIRGPLLGASIRGTVNYDTQRVSLGGTYVPLQGINSAFCDIPLFGPIVAGLDCQGVFGITYAIQGPMRQPQVLVNPLSMLTPGIFRGIMEMTNPNPQVQPLRDRQNKSAGGRTRASPSPSTIDGWSSETTVPGRK